MLGADFLERLAKVEAAKRAAVPTATGVCLRVRVCVYVCVLVHAIVHSPLLQVIPEFLRGVALTSSSSFRTLCTHSHCCQMKARGSVRWTPGSAACAAMMARCLSLRCRPAAPPSASPRAMTT